MSFSLEQYLSKLTLEPITHGPSAPPMPSSRNGRSVKTPMKILPGGYRRLKLIEAMYDLEKEAAEYFSNVETIQKLRGLKLDIPEKVSDQHVAFNPYVINHHSHISSFLNRFILRNVLKMLNTMDNDMCEWNFRSYYHPRRDPCHNQSIETILFCRTDPTDDKPKSVKLIVIPLCPWEFTPQDFEDLVRTTRFDDTPNDQNDMSQEDEWFNAEMMKAYLYDICLEFNCPYFVVSSHEQWSFGFFSKYFTTEFLTPPMSFLNQAPGILETLMYWIHVALEKPNTPPIPKIEDEEQISPETWEKERQLLSLRYLKNDPASEFETKKRNVSEAEIDAIQLEAKRARTETTDREELKRERKLHPTRRLYGKLRNAIEVEKKEEAKKQQAVAARDPITGSVRSFDLSVAPSCVGPIPRKMVPHRKNTAIRKWCDLMFEEHLAMAAEKKTWVDALEADPTTGDPTGFMGHLEDLVCSSCGPPTPTLSACSVTEEEVACWNQTTDNDEEEKKFGGLKFNQWQ